MYASRFTRVEQTDWKSQTPRQKHMKSTLRVNIRVGFDIDGLKVSLRILVIFEYQNSEPQLFEYEEHSSNTFYRLNRAKEYF